ncbi:hypothetical protein K438DRAFT_273653 [Mycena galopus ATCC 62051]|nr:hypothetical protein K438DRAFT_273653 [Mycena galopus ATCC 62051]
MGGCFEHCPALWFFAIQRRMSSISPQVPQPTGSMQAEHPRRAGPERNREHRRSHQLGRPPSPTAIDHPPLFGFIPDSHTLLTDLTITVGLPSITLDILTKCADLIRASIMARDWDKLPQAQDIIVLTHLRTLSLAHFSVARDVTAFLPYISAPALQKLCVDSESNLVGRWTEAHFTTIQLRAPHLTQLEFINSNFTSGDLGAIIRHVPFITHLKLCLCVCATLTLLSSVPSIMKTV